MILATVVGIAFMASFFLVFALQLDIKEHNVLRNLLIIFSFSSLLLIPNAIINQQVCEPLLNDSYEIYMYGNNFTGYHWDYNTGTAPDGPQVGAYLFHKNVTNTYEEHCYNPMTSAKGFLKAANLAYLVFIAYIIVYLGYKSLLWLYESVRRRG